MQPAYLWSRNLFWFALCSEKDLKLKSNHSCSHKFALTFITAIKSKHSWFEEYKSMKTYSKIFWILQVMKNTLIHGLKFMAENKNSALELESYQIEYIPKFKTCIRMFRFPKICPAICSWLWSDGFELQSQFIDYTPICYRNGHSAIT